LAAIAGRGSGKTSSREKKRESALIMEKMIPSAARCRG
jgi:hypothetical protein